MCLLNTLFLISLAVIGGYSQRLPSFIKQCSLSDPGLTKCLTTTAQNSLKSLADGVPEINLPPLDPLKVGQVTVDQLSLKTHFKDSYILGLKDCRINELRIDEDAKKIYLNYTKDGSFNAKYFIDGQILVIPVKGEGDCTLKFKNLNYFFAMDYVTQKGKDGRDHWKITKHQVTYDTENCNFRFTNLFGGNKQLGDTAHRVLNENCKSVFSELSPPIITKVAKTMVNYLQKLFENVPVEELILP